MRPSLSPKTALRAVNLRLPLSNHVLGQPYPSRLRRHFGLSTHLREEKRQSFKGQLYESTQQRIKRERAEQERFSQYQTQSSGARYAALMFGALFPLPPFSFL